MYKLTIEFDDAANAAPLKVQSKNPEKGVVPQQSAIVVCVSLPKE